MKGFISLKFYPVLNYIMALLLISFLWTFGTRHLRGAAVFLPLIIGWLQLIMAIFSNNKGGFIKVFPMVMHNFNDVIMGSFLMCSPLIYDFHEVWLPHVLCGAVLFIMGVFTQGSPFINKYQHPHEGSGITSTDSFE
ncbi:MAG TPA: hypothetical protein VIM77_14150 [Mucilaginibacter sp.]